MNFIPKRRFFNFFRRIFSGGSLIKYAYTKKDYLKLKELLEKSDQFEFLKVSISGSSMIHDAVANNDHLALDIFNDLEYIKEVVNNQK